MLGLVNSPAGSDEGAFAWLTLNYLLGFLGRDGADTMAAIDLGGGSVQEAFALTDVQAKAAPDPLYVTKLKGGGRTYSVYVHRFVQTHAYFILLIVCCSSMLQLMEWGGQGWGGGGRGPEGRLKFGHWKSLCLTLQGQ